MTTHSPLRFLVFLCWAMLLLPAAAHAEVKVSKVTNASSATACDGEIEVTATGSAAPFQLTLKQGGTTVQQSGLVNGKYTFKGVCAGQYTITVWNSVGCSTSLTATVGVCSNTTWSIAHEITPACYRERNGAIALTINGSGYTPPLQYFWSNGARTEDLQNLPAGFYEVVVKDQNGCKKVGGEYSVQISTVSVIDYHYATSPPNNASIYIDNVYSAHPPLTYQWSNGATTEDLVEVSPAIYTVTVTNAFGCTTTKIFDARGCSNPINLSATVKPDNLWKNPPEKGSISINVSGGMPPYQYQWNWYVGSHQVDQPTVTGLRAGVYTVTVTDDCGKTAILTETVAKCRFKSVFVQDNCTDDPEIIITGCNGTCSWSPDDLNWVPWYGNNNSGSPTFCDRSITVTWDDGTVSYSVIDEDLLSNNAPVATYFPYKYSKRDVDSDDFGRYCIKMVDVCGCENEVCVNVGAEQSAVGFTHGDIQNYVPNFPVPYDVVTQCFQCKVCGTPGDIPAAGYMQEDACDRGFHQTLLQYENNNSDAPCTGGLIRCLEGNSTYPVYEGISGDLLVDWGAEPVRIGNTCVYPLGCLFPAGTIQGIYDPVYVKSPIGYSVPYQNGLCEYIDPTPDIDCDGQVIQDILGIDEECNIKLFCITPGGYQEVGAIFVGTVCRCGFHAVVKICPPKPGDGDLCDHVGNPLFEGQIVFPTPNGGFEYTDAYLAFLDTYRWTHGLPSNFDFPQCPGDPPFTGDTLEQRIQSTFSGSSNLISVYPNPVTNELSLQVLSGSPIVDIVLFDVLGETVATVKSVSVLQANFIKLPLNDLDLPAGIYLLQVDLADGFRGNFKVVKPE